VLAYGLLATLTSAVLAGLVPALRASRVSAPALGAAGRSVSSRRGSRLATTLVGAQLTLAMVVVVASGLMLRSLVSMTTEDPGLDGRGVLVLRPSPPEGRYPSGVAFHAYYDEVLARVRALPAVESASAIHLLPGTRDNWNFPTFIDGVDVVDGEVIPAVNIRVVWPEYFETVGMGLQQGRTLLPTDNRETEPVVVVNQAFVDRFWPGEAALGRELRLLSTEAAPHRVVGVVRNVRQHGFGREPLPEMYFSHGQLTWNMSFWIAARVRDDGAPLAWADEIRSAVWSVDPDVPIGTIDELSRVMGASAATTRFSAAVLGAFGALALLLSAVGVFGVTAQGVGRRIPEFGVRIALGASRAEMVGAALGGTAVAVVAGLGAGILVAALSTEALSTALYEVEPTDPVTFAGVACLLLAVATLAALIPAWRAARVDPVTALKDAP
jgi:predicted permease